MKRLLVVIAWPWIAQTAWANGLVALEKFVRTVSSGRADFTQVVTAPAREGQASRSKSSSGTFEFSRPNRFRFVYHKPFDQTIVADGQTLWLYDADLNQVSARKQALALGATPAALIAASPDLRLVQAEFTLQAAPATDGLEWVVASPRTRDGQLQSVRVGFRTDAATVTLAVLEILDNFGQRSVLTFENVEINPSLPMGIFSFKPPPGSDLIRQ
jgi:outer membrane lipoprotein carrier protein